MSDPQLPWWMPSYRAICTLVCVLYTLLVGNILLQGIEASFAPFGVPAAMLRSAHYQDAMLWVYLHMMFIGWMVGLVGWFATSDALKRNMARLLFVTHCVYTYLDFRASDSMLGVALYKGPGSLFVSIFSLIVTLLFLYLSLNGRLYQPKTPRA